MLDLWHGFGAETKSALIGGVSVLIAAFLGFGSLILQVGWQGRQSRSAAVENEKRRLKAAIYEDGIAICRDLADAAIYLSTQLRQMELEISVAVRANSVGLSYPIPSVRFPALMKKYSEFSDSALRFVFLVENRRIIDPRILVFRSAISVVLHDTRNLMYRDFVVEVMPALPVESSNGEPFPYNPPSSGALERIAVLTKLFLESLSDAVSYTEDFSVEIQNNLIGDLFANRLSHRVPIDPNSKVITLENSNALAHWFETNTEWGRMNSKIKAETRVRFHHVETGAIE